MINHQLHVTNDQPVRSILDDIISMAFLFADVERDILKWRKYKKDDPLFNPNLF